MSGASFRGQVTVPFGGRQYILEMDFNALCTFEEMTGLNALQTLNEDMDDISATALRALFHAALLKRHPKMTPELAGDILAENIGAIHDLQASVDSGAQETGKTKARKGAGR